MAQGISLHLGLNSVDPTHYQGWDGALNACEADARAMERIATARGFAATKLLSGDGTRAALERAIANAAATLQAGDSFLLSYSGHGGQIPDFNGDEDDALDETWCLFDGELLDDELYQFWKKFRRGVRITVISDSCHSGSVVRMMMLSGLMSSAMNVAAPSASEARPRVMPPDVMRETYVAHQEFYDDLASRASEKGRIGASVILVSGCQDNQLSLDGPFNGAFTGQLLATYRNGAFKGNYNDLAKAVRAKLPVTQSPNYLEVGTSNRAHSRARCFTI